MEKTLKEIGGYDDPTRQKLTQHEIYLGTAEAVSLLSAGVDKLQKMIMYIKVEDQLKHTLTQSTMTIIEELTKIYESVNEFTKTNLMGQVKPVDMLSKGFSDHGGMINMNETEQGKIEKTINRIIEVNKKLNYHGTK
jgi:hypothetical protein